MIVGDLTKQVEFQNVVKNMIDLAIEFVSLNEAITYYGKKINLRIGINSGTVVIGILGIDIPRLCVIGNTVNKASRLESTSKTNKIQISEELYEIIKDDPKYQFELNKNVYLKNIGNFNTYFISSK